MSEWIPCKTVLPPEHFKVLGKNTLIEAISWISGKNDLGKPSWCHKEWEHADDFVSHWKPVPAKVVVQDLRDKNVIFVGSYRSFQNFHQEAYSGKIIAITDTTTNHRFMDGRGNNFHYVEDVKEIRGITGNIILLHIELHNSDDDMLKYIKAQLLNQNEVYIVDL